MSRYPFDSAELGRHDADMDRVAARLEGYASDMGEPPIDLAVRIRAALDEEPIPPTGWWASLLATLAGWQGPLRLVVATAVLAIAVVGAVVLGDLADRARESTGSSPPPSQTMLPSPMPSPTPTPTPSPTPTLTPSPSSSASETADPSASDDDDDEVETPEPSESDDDNSGSGGGDNSGPGGG
ncbi:MAG: hypothetical protein LC798_00120 [Chloroflexi bacterium]|nr:hypothetical protein [Chloroflexota bacterium]